MTFAALASSITESLLFCDEVSEFESTNLVLQICNDFPQPTAPLGYVINHFVLVVSGPETTLHVYHDIIVMRAMIDCGTANLTFL